MAIIDTIRNMIRKKREMAAKKHAQDMLAFLDKCEHFRLLLAANHAALEIMSDMGEALGGLRPVDMNHVRSGCVGTVAAVGRMVQALQAMARGSYEELSPRLREIACDLDRIIHTDSSLATGNTFVVPLMSVAGKSQEGGPKTANLALAGKELNIAIPNGFVFTADAFSLFMGQGLREEIQRLTIAAETHDLEGLYKLSAHISRAIQAEPIPAIMRKQFQNCIASFPEISRYAVRSSALDEDTQRTSFAGQYHSVLNVCPEGIMDAYREVVASAFSVRAMSYRKSRGLRDDEIIMCVACMEMIDADTSGVMYTQNPLAPEDGTLQVHAVPGLPVSIVDGSCNPDVWTILREQMRISSATIASKETVQRCSPSKGIEEQKLPSEKRSAPALSDATVLKLAQMGNKLEDFFGCPQDIEWAIRDAAIVLLQCRPLEVQTAISPECPYPCEGAVLQGGTTASPGIAAGPVHVVRSEEDLLTFPQGAILITEQAHPTWASALYKAAGIVACHGSTAGHLANIARESRIPALFGIEDAVRQLQIFPEITVDATNKAIFEGIQTEHLPEADEAPQADPLLENSPVIRCLRCAMDLIIPLNLKDAHSPDFTPSGCKTLHDITRFCHEMGVNEMFNRPDSTPTSAARRLVTDVPTQYWILDIGGGTTSQATRTVSLSQITSSPMHALWHGMHEKPWQGPPPPSTGGFLSVVMQAATNPELAPGAANEMGNRNYFILGEKSF